MEKQNKVLIVCIILILTLVLPAVSAAITCSGNGGTITIDGDYCVHTFTSNETFITTQNITVQYLVVGGGGGGVGFAGGGGGAGGLLTGTTSVTANTNINITVGLGGLAAYGSGTLGNNGENSSFGNIIAVGGGASGSELTGANGGSGGGGGGAGNTGVAGNGGSGIVIIRYLKYSSGLKNGLQAYWTFNESGTTFTDSINSINLTFANLKYTCIYLKWN